MTSEKAIHILKTMREAQLNDKYSEALEAAIEALEKQIPKRPDESYNGYSNGYPVWEFYCPNCGEEIDDTDHHCVCGQEIEWVDEDTYSRLLAGYEKWKS
mgnify:CR=1 FL=1